VFYSCPVLNYTDFDEDNVINTNWYRDLKLCITAVGDAEMCKNR